MNVYSETVIFPGRYDSLSGVAQFIKTATRAASLDECTAYNIEMAVDEACSNIIEHAYAGNVKGDIECSCLVTDKDFTVILGDTGIPFNPSGVNRPNPKAPLKNRKRGGLGLFFMYNLMDDVRFDFSIPGKNRVIMIKHLDKLSP